MFTLIAHAAETTSSIDCSSGITDLTSLINFFTCILMNSIIPLLVSLALAGFVYGIIKYFLSADSEEGRKKGKSFMIWGFVAIFLIVSFWGVVKIFTNTFDTGNPVVPHLPDGR